MIARTDEMDSDMGATQGTPADTAPAMVAQQDPREGKYVWQPGDIEWEMDPGAGQPFRPGQMVKAMEAAAQERANPKVLAPSFRSYHDDLDGAHQMGLDLYQNWADSLHPLERDAIRHYKEEGYADVNHLLRNFQHYPKEELYPYVPLVQRLDSALDKSKVWTNLRAYRGFHSPALDQHWGPNLQGKVFNDKGYQSTSLNPRVAMRFARMNDGMLADILIPRGLHGAYIEAMDPDMHESLREHEMLLPRRARYRIQRVWEEPDSRAMSGRLRRIEMLALPPASAPPTPSAQTAMMGNE